MTNREQSILLIVPAFVLGSITTRGVEALYSQQSINWPETFQALQNIAQIVAFLFAGVWTYRLFVRQRMDQLRTNVTHEVTHVLLSEEHRLLRVIVQIHNIGNVEICPSWGEVSIHKIKPADEKLVASFLSDSTDVESITPEKSWPIEQKRSMHFKKDKLTLEPNEIERYTRDFILSSTISVVQVHSFVWMRDDTTGTYWDETTIVSLTDN